jgi:hypothetical protein
MTPTTSTLSYRGTPIRLRGAMLNLTDMWRAAGCPEHRRPAKWLAFDETARFRSHAHVHWTGPEEPAFAENVLQEDIIRLDPDGLVAALRGRRGGTWAHWQLALSYARYLSPEFHLWCNTVVRAAMEWRAGPPRAEHDPLLLHLAREFRALHRRLDTLERHAADLMFLVLSAQDLLLDKRRDFSERSQADIAKVAAAEPSVAGAPAAAAGASSPRAVGCCPAPRSTTSSIAA